MGILQLLELDSYYDEKPKEEIKTGKYATVDPYGNYKMINVPSYISVFNNKENYYDTKTYEDRETGAVYPILNLSDYYTNHIVESLKNWDTGKIGNKTVGFTTHDISSVLLNKQLYQEEGRLSLPGFNPLEIEETHPNDDRTLAAIIKDPNTKSLFEKYADMWDYESNKVALESMMIYNQDDFENYKKEWVSSQENQALDYLDNFKEEFGPFRGAVNKSILELTEPYKMKELLTNYRDAYKKHFEFSNNEHESRKTALKQILGGAIETKIQEQQVGIPDFMRGNMMDMWLDYNLGITTPELNLQAMMFHNDGFRKIIDTFDNYLNEDEIFEAKETKPWGMNLTFDDYKNPEKYITNLNDGIDSLMFKINNGEWTHDETVLAGQKNVIKSYLLRDAINQTHAASAEGFIPEEMSTLPTYMWWLVPTPAGPITRGYINHMANAWFALKAPNALSASDNLLRQVYNMPNIIGGSSGNIPFKSDKIAKTTWQNIKGYGRKGLTWAGKAGKKALPKANSLGLVLYLNEFGPSVASDLSGYFFGGDASIEYPKTELGRNIFNSFGWQPDEGEKGFEDKPLQSLKKSYKEMFFGPTNEGVSYASNMHEQMTQLYDGIADVIVKGQNDVLQTGEHLETLGMKFISDIQNSPEFKAIGNDKDKKDYFLKEFNNRVFSSKYAGILNHYVTAHNSFEGAMNLINKISISGQDADSLVLRKVPKPESFPQELWDELISISTMSENEYIKAYGKDGNITNETIKKYNEVYENYKYPNDHRWYGIKSVIEAINEGVIGNKGGIYGMINEDVLNSLSSNHNLELLTTEDDRFTAIPYTHPKYGNNFNQTTFREIQTNSKSIFSLPSLQELNKIVDSMFEGNFVSPEEP